VADPDEPSSSRAVPCVLVALVVALALLSLLLQ
jgi:hypothetical protein